MKRISFLMVALLLMGGLAMAQGQRRENRKVADPKVRAERMTERMAKEYSLNDAQKKELLEANTALTEKAAKCPTGMKQGKKDKDGKSCCDRKEGENVSKMSKEDKQKLRQEMQASRQAYDVQLKKIMTDDQYAAYTKKQAERQQKMKERRK